VDVLPVQLAKFLPYVDRINEEVTLLRGWRKDNNRLEKEVAKKEALRKARPGDCHRGSGHQGFDRAVDK
jgi:hypothetical protein